MSKSQASTPDSAAAAVTSTMKKVTIPPPNDETIVLRIRGVGPRVENAFPRKAREQMAEKQRQGSQGTKGKMRQPKDFEDNYRQSMHIATDGWHGIPASAFRNGLISACRTVSFKMTLGKLSLFIVADGYDKEDGTPLVRVTGGKPRMVVHPVRNESGVADLRARAMWDEWEATLRIRYNKDFFTEADIANLVMRLGRYVGVGEGRNDSPNSAGMGWGEFEVMGLPDEAAAAAGA